MARSIWLVWPVAVLLLLASEESRSLPGQEVFRGTAGSMAVDVYPDTLELRAMLPRVTHCLNVVECLNQTMLNHGIERIRLTIDQLTFIPDPDQQKDPVTVYFPAVNPTPVLRSRSTAPPLADFTPVISYLNHTIFRLASTTIETIMLASSEYSSTASGQSSDSSPKHTNSIYQYAHGYWYSNEPLPTLESTPVRKTRQCNEELSSIERPDSEGTLTFFPAPSSLHSSSGSRTYTVNYQPKQLNSLSGIVAESTGGSQTSSPGHGKYLSVRIHFLHQQWRQYIITATQPET